MRIEDLYIDDLCENEERIIIDAIASTIEEDGFDISHFSLFSVEGYTWEFVSNRNAERGFLLFYNPKVVNKPIPQYQLLNGSVAYSFDARNITEAYIQHNKRIPDEDYYLLSMQYSKTETEYHKKAQVLAQKYGSEVICKIYNCTEEWLNS